MPVTTKAWPDILRRIEDGLTVSFVARAHEPLVGLHEDGDFLTLRTSDHEFYSISQCAPELPLRAALGIAILDFDSAKELAIKRRESP